MKRKIMSALSVVGGAIKKAGVKIAASVAAADTKTLIKFGVLIGVATVTAALIIKFLKDKKKSYHSEENRTVVDEAINVNYNDLDQQEKLHPLMKKVKKNLKKDLKPRKKVSGKDKKIAKAKKAFDSAAYNEKMRRKFDQFLKDMAFEDEYEDEINALWGQEDDMSLRTIWDEP